MAALALGALALTWVLVSGSIPDYDRDFEAPGLKLAGTARV